MIQLVEADALLVYIYQQELMPALEATHSSTRQWTSQYDTCAMTASKHMLI